MQRRAWIIFWASSGIALVIGGVRVIATNVTNQMREHVRSEAYQSVIE